MAEAAGLVLGVGSTLTAFKGSLDTALLIESYFSDEKSNCSFLALCYHTQKTRLELWRQVYNIDDPSMCALKDKPEKIQELVIRILAQITQLLDELQKLVVKHGVELPSMPLVNPNIAPQSQVNIVTTLSKLRVKPKARFLWTIKGKAEFEENVSKISNLFDELEHLTVSPSESHLIEKTLPSMSLNHITNTSMLQSLHDPKAKASTTLVMSAKAKLMRVSSAQPSDAPGIGITTSELQIWKGSESLGNLTLPGQTPITVWIEWSIIGSGKAAPEYVRRVKALGYLLKEAGDPALRLPVCYGIFDDLKHEVEFGVQRIGYVFGAPQTGLSSPLLHRSAEPSRPIYTTDFRIHPPRTLSSLIRDKSFPIPPLGDRFTLAFELATAFSNLHSAGWLHKGFHSGSILFLANCFGQEAVIKVTDPFITGFQYSRPTGDESLSRGPLENSELEYYYHPAADKGFSRRTDLYSLGVVLCEIGRWYLITSTVSDQRRQKMADRTSWYNYLTSKLLPDIGWRMGERYQSAVQTLLGCQLPGDEESSVELFEREYLAKVIQPLSECSA
ncbi:hypothetical protein F5Y12DRAFT_736485 [Xylaria sp. FL1777]|nr:hypothetical protein F5Y12DRAFT_736485 [Xylaria sp. FL1777]